jgi:CubicO group peptidase (beta-lactamase class C family)
MLEKAARIIEDGIAAGLHPGAQLYVSLEGRTVADLAIGEARAGVAMTPDTIVLWMSSVKPITVVAIAKLWERGEVALDDRVARYIPEFGCKGKEPITIRDVLTHTGGFRQTVGAWSLDPWDQIIAQICDSELEAGWIPGVHQGYHVASGWYVLAELVRRIDGRPFSCYAREEVLEPLGMRDTWIGIPPEVHERCAHRIAPMHFAAGIKRPEPHRYFAWTAEADACAICRPGGNGRGPIHDLGRFYEALLDGGRGVIRPQTVEAIGARHTVGLKDRTFGYQLDRGLGVVVDSKQYGPAAAWFGNRCSPRTFGHAGYVCSVGFADPEHRLAVALQFNAMLEAEPTKHDERAAAVIDAVYDELGLARAT